MANEEVGIRLTLQGRREAASELKDTEQDLTDVGDAAEEAGKKADKSAARWKKFRGVMGGVGHGVGRVAGGIGRGLVSATKAGIVGLVALTAATAVASSKAIALASDARETGSAFRTVFGPNVKQVRKELGGLSRDFGLYTPDLQDAARQFGVFGKAAKIPKKDLSGFSTSLVRAGLDLSSFYNSDPGETFQALQSGLSGEAEPLRKFGIFISDASMKAQAASMGLTGELTEQQKVMVRQKIIMKSLGDAQGDLARTSGGFANQQRAASGRLKTFFSILGGPLTTAATGAFRGFNKLAQKGIRMLRKELPGLEHQAGNLSDTFERWGNRAARKLPSTLSRIRGSAASLRDVVGDLKKKWKNFTDNGGDEQLSTMSTNMAALGPAVGVAAAELPGLTDILSVTNIVFGFLADHTDTLIKFMPALAAGFVAYKVAQALANVAAAASVPLKIADIIATRQLTREMRGLVAAQAGAATGGTVAAGAIGAQAGATAGATGAQRGLNGAMRANPIGAVIAVVALLVAGFILLYRKSDTFRGMVDGLWNNVLVPFGEFLGGVFIGYLKLLAKMWLSMGRFGVMAFRWLLTAAFKTFDGILGAAEAGLGWVPGMGKKIKGARAAFNEFGDSTIAKLKRVEDKLRDTQNAIDGVARDRSATINITTAYKTLGSPTRGRTDEYGVPARARGGDVRAGSPYVVGEHRPELFVPKVNGMIVPKVPDMTDLGNVDMTVGPIGPSGPTVIRLVMPDGRIIMETVVDEFHDAEAHL